MWFFNDKYEVVVVWFKWIFWSGKCIVCVILFSRWNDYYGRIWFFGGILLWLNKLYNYDWFVGDNFVVSGGWNEFLYYIFGFRDGESWGVFFCNFDNSVIFVCNEFKVVVYSFFWNWDGSEVFVLGVYWKYLFY